MWKCLKIILLICIISSFKASYLEFQIIRFQVKDKSFHMEPMKCKNETALSSDAEYKEICYEKDIAYSIPFFKDRHFMLLSADFTVPISWLKGQDCKIQGTQKKCSRIHQRVGEKIKQAKENLIKKLKKNKPKADEVENSIIEGSSQTIRGQIQNTQNISFVSKDSSRLSNFFQIVMLGLFIYGEKDTLTLQKTNFINATTLSANLNHLVDGAISLRFDQASENSFINEIFTYVKATQKTVCVYLGDNSTLTIGDLTTKYTAEGFSGINWVSMPDDEGYGKLPQVSAVGLDFFQEDDHQEDDETIPAVVTLSASYIGIPQSLLNIIIKNYKKYADCSVNNTTFYLQCKYKNTKSAKEKNANFYFTLDGHNILVPMSTIILEQKKSTITFNIKKTFNNRIILGEPIFRAYTLIFDYSNNKIGFSQKRQGFNNSSYFISTVHLVRMIFFIFIFGTLGTIFYNPIMNCLKKGQYKTDGLLQPRKKQYAPIQQNPYEDLNSKIQDALSSTDRQVQGI